jgi:hypothetical protein
MNAVLSEGAVSAIHNWRNRARKKRKARDQGDDPDSDQTPESPRDSTDTSDHSTIDIELPHTNGLLHHEKLQRVNEGEQPYYSQN